MQNRVESLRRIKEPISKAYPKPQTASCKISTPPPPPTNGVQFAGFCLWFSLPLHDGHCQQGRARTSPHKTICTPTPPDHGLYMYHLPTIYSQPPRSNKGTTLHSDTWGVCILTTFWLQPPNNDTTQPWAVYVPPANHLLTTTTEQ
jgi:hypothetical protein